MRATRINTGMGLGLWLTLGLCSGLGCGDVGAAKLQDDVGGFGGGSSGSGGSGGSGDTGGAAGDAGAAGLAGAGGTPPGAGVGEACEGDAECRAGLVCTDGQCAPGGSTGEGDRCTISAECAEGLYCAAGRCAPGGMGAVGDPCTSDAGCQTGLRCEVAGFALKCVPGGSVDIGGACTASTDCFAGLSCTNGACGRDAPGGPLGRALSFPGVDCQPIDETAPTRAYFEVPGAEPAGQTHDFFRLPFPNDVRRKNGGLDLTGFPTPGSALLGYDPVQRYVEALANDAAWGTYPTVHFRFSKEIDFESLRDDDLVADNDPLLFLDITPGRELGANAGAVYAFNPNRQKYVCEHALSVRRWDGRPLVPGHTYVVQVTTAARDAAGQPIQRSEHFAALLAATAPSDPVLAAAHAAYAPYREFLAARSISPDTILTAAVFTAGTVRQPMQELAEAVIARGTPPSSGWVRCDGVASSPCPQAEGDRACVVGPAEYDEYHALVTLPRFQVGTPPYLTPEDGGDVSAASAAAGDPVCISLTIPKGVPMPAEGWPLVVTAHGTGGSFRSHVRPEIAGALSRVVTTAGEVRFAVLGFDQVQHGPRRGASMESPDNLFFNFANPKAARGNPLQGAADQIAMGLFARALDVPATTTGGDAIRVNPNAVVFFGHSQGATHGSMALPFTNDYRAAVLSGNGASLMHALLNKTQPVDIAAALPLVLGDVDPFTGRLPGQPDHHPALALLQQWSDPVDPLNFARVIGTEPLAGHTATHLFQTYGQRDSFAPPITLATFAIAGELPQAPLDASAAAMPDEIRDAPPAAAPLAAPGPGGAVIGVRQYAPPAGRDGHFIVFDVASANADVMRFLALAALGQAPVIGQ